MITFVCRTGSSSRVLSDTMAERPVLFRDFHQLNDDVIRTSLQLALNVICDTFIESFLKFNGTPGAHRDLDENEM
jgi:hypothetical protein